MTLVNAVEKKTEETEEEFFFEPTHKLVLSGCRPISFWRQTDEIKEDLND